MGSAGEFKVEEAEAHGRFQGAQGSVSGRRGGVQVWSSTQKYRVLLCATHAVGWGGFLKYTSNHVPLFEPPT